jgi:pimeloyl-ACP methyl ester carboxylesterase
MRTLTVKVVLALVSVGLYWLVVALAERFDWSGTVFGFQWPFHLIGLIFGALVMAPYAARTPQHIVRMIALAVASAAIYQLAVRFVVDGPLGHSTITPYVIAGAGSALLTGIAIALIVPRRFSWQLAVFTLVAGAIGGAAFDWQLPLAWAPNDLHAYLAWQLLVCLALDRGLRA